MRSLTDCARGWLYITRKKMSKGGCLHPSLLLERDRLARALKGDTAWGSILREHVLRQAINDLAIACGEGARSLSIEACKSSNIKEDGVVLTTVPQWVLEMRARFLKKGTPCK